MPKYLFLSSYTAEGLKGVLSKGGTARQEAITAALESVGGRLDAFYFAFGGDDAYVIVDLPDNVSAASAALTVGASGMASVKTVVLLTPEEVDRAAQAQVEYRPPGS